MVCRAMPNFKKCIEAEEKLTVDIRYILVIAVRMKRDYMCRMLHAATVQCDLKGKVTAAIN